MYARDRAAMGIVGKVYRNASPGEMSPGEISVPVLAEIDPRAYTRFLRQSSSVSQPMLAV